MNTITDSDRIAMCRACTLAECMKVCKVCPFNIGLSAEQAKILDFRTNELKSPNSGD